jgi:hypothetical protein
MQTLDYQSSDDARSQRRFNLWSRLFGLTQEEAWTLLAKELNGRLEQGVLGDDRVVAQSGAWRMILDCTSRGSTRLRAPYVSRDGFRFRIWRASAFDKFEGLPDVEVGDRSFDDHYIVQSNHPATVRKFLKDAKLRWLVNACPHLMFEVRDHSDDLSTGPVSRDMDELHLLAAGLITDVDRLRRMFDLFAESLTRLHEIGSAEDRSSV